MERVRLIRRNEGRPEVPAVVPDLTKFKERYGLTRRSRLTDDKVLRARARKATYRIWNSGDGMCQGLHVMVYRTGKKTWRVRYDCPISGKRRGMTLGSADELDLAGARKAAREALRRASRRAASLRMMARTCRPVCKRRSKNPSVKRPIRSVAPE